jgi:large subunit ribosomal protein L32
VRHQPEYRFLRLQSEVGRPALRGTACDEAHGLTVDRRLRGQNNAKSQTAALQIADGQRRTHDALTATQTSDCPNCREPKPSHRACPHCGYYRGRQVRAVDEA